MSQLNTINFRVFPSTETNDHEVKIFVDDRDFIAQHWPDMMGMDPEEILSLHTLLPRDAPHEATVVRCGCGVVGCGSTQVRISAEGERVIWDSWMGDPGSPRPQTLIFARGQYEQAVKDAVDDHSWETPERTAARILRSLVDHDALAANNLKYQWASGRIRDARFTVSLGGPAGCHQILVYLPWKKQSSDEIATEAAALLKTDPNQWPDVVWFGDASAPPFSGRTWRKNS